MENFLGFLPLLLVIATLIGVLIFMRNRRKKYGTPPLKGVAGWLAWLVFCLIVLAPLIAISTTANEISSSERLYPNLVGKAFWENLKMWTWFLSAIQASAFFLAGIRLWKFHNPKSVMYTQLAFWIAGLGINFFAAFALVPLVTGVSEAPSSTAVGELAKTLITVAVWSLYLKVSKRVQATYYADQPVLA
ncbi:DUF2569 family protein [uncultured Xylophilus sp.]|uniref:DUF2569 family protein n=1 Tax=uncultured Xylophilus sp. TaxID=296832 RepID=UPI0025FBE756|nr:DUF2569 family protein [uncultured Xylophilus sp.]